MTWRGNFEGGRGQVEDMPDMCGGRYTQSDSALAASVQFGCRLMWCTLAQPGEYDWTVPWAAVMRPCVKFFWPLVKFPMLSLNQVYKLWLNLCAKHDIWHVSACLACRLACLHGLRYGVLVWLSTDRFSDWFNFYTVSQNKNITQPPTIISTIVVGFQ